MLLKLKPNSVKSVMLKLVLIVGDNILIQKNIKSTVVTKFKPNSVKSVKLKFILRVGGSILIQKKKLGEERKKPPLYSLTPPLSSFRPSLSNLIPYKFLSILETIDKNLADYYYNNHHLNCKPRGVVADVR